MRKLSRRLAAIAAAAGLTWAALGAATPAAAATCETSFKTYTAVKAGTSGAQAKAVQCLIRRTHRPVRADGSFSAADATALKAFQRSRKLAPTGRANKGTWIALISYGSRPGLNAGDRGANVVRLQRALRAAGYKSLTGTGFYGTKTVTAVKMVQRGNGHKVTGTVSTKFWRLLQSGKLKPGKKAPKPKRAVASASASSKGAKALAFAKRQLGDRYGYGGTGPNVWDCSGLTQGAYRAAGVKLPHNSRAQMKYGASVKKSALKKGDLVFFYSPVSHVAIYAGGGKVVQASRPGKPVNLGTMAYMPFAGARRIG